MVVFEQSWRMDRMLDGVRLTFEALAVWDAERPARSEENGDGRKIGVSTTLATRVADDRRR